MIINLLDRLNHTNDELPLIIYTTDNIYAPSFIVEEDEHMLSIVVVDNDGHEFGKIINKKYLISIEIFYEEMVEEVKDDKQKMYY